MFSWEEANSPVGLQQETKLEGGPGGSSAKEQGMPPATKSKQSSDLSLDIGSYSTLWPQTQQNRGRCRAGVHQYLRNGFIQVGPGAEAGLQSGRESRKGLQNCLMPPGCHFFSKGFLMCSHLHSTHCCFQNVTRKNATLVMTLLSAPSYTVSQVRSSIASLFTGLLGCRPGAVPSSTQSLCYVDGLQVIEPMQ